MRGTTTVRVDLQSGGMHEVHEAVAALVEDQVATGQQLGVQVAAIWRGELVVDVAAGRLDPDRLDPDRDGTPARPVHHDSLFCCFSVTKALAALEVWALVQAGRIDLRAPLAQYWPAVRSAVTVGQVLTHRAALHRAPRPLDTAVLADDRAGLDWVASLAPAWPPGEASGYHTLTYGWLVRGLVEAVTGERFPARFAPEVFCGLPAAEVDRAATVVESAGARGLEWIVTNGTIHPAAEAMPPEFVPDWNDPRMRAACQPAFSGWASARSLAACFAPLASGGGERFAPGTVEAMRTLVVDEVDRCLEIPVRRSHGFELGGRYEGGSVGALGPKEGAFGHGGHGGQVVVVDPEAELTIAVLANLLPAPQLASERTTVICELIRGLTDAA